jgi:hypothetical protein
LSTPARNNFFYGKLMDVCHFEMEQDYFNLKRWLLNRLSLGYGVLCGLQVKPAEDTAEVVIEPGVAIDALGREIIVPATSRSIDPRKLTDVCGRPTGETVDQGTVGICLAYTECPENLVPVLVGDCETTQGCAPSTICERYRVLVVKKEDMTGRPPPACPGSGLLDVDASGILSSASYKSLAKLISKACPTVEGRPCVPLAYVELDGALKIHNGERPLVFSNELLFELLLCVAGQAGGGHPVVPDWPKVVDINWTHDDTLAQAQFMEGLKVTFDRNMSAKTATGPAWFIVTLEQAVRQPNPPEVLAGTRFVYRALEEEGGIDVADDTAYFKPSEEVAKALSYLLESQGALPMCRVVLRCNFLADATDGTLVADGSGNDVPGSDFESWFFLTRED